MQERLKLSLMIVTILLLALVGYNQIRLEGEIKRIDERVEFTQQRMLYELNLSERNASLIKYAVNKIVHTMEVK